MNNAGNAYAYSNPFYAASSYASDSGLDYSQPIEVPAPTQINVNYGSYAEAPAETTTYSPPQYVQQVESPPQYVQQAESAPQYVQQAESTPPPAETAADSVPPEATQYFDAGLAAFKEKDYAKALSDVDLAIKVLNKDATMHEFRALVLFAQKKYKDAAAGIYAVLSVGPGWNWQTMSSLYASPDTYTTQLRDLENYQRTNPDAPDGHFLLAYHYLVTDHTQDALTQLEKFAKLVPKDQLAPELIKAFTAAPSDKPTAEAK
jgi:tetratricopeptide (TPR) repeat protein